MVYQSILNIHSIVNVVDYILICLFKHIYLYTVLGKLSFKRFVFNLKRVISLYLSKNLV